jgi:DNA repair protein RadD
MYRKLLPKIKANYVGFTATHFRLGHGYIHRGENALFNELAYDMSTPEIFSRLVEEGYLTKLITKATVMKMDTDGIRTRARDYAVNELSNRFDRESITNVAVDEIIQFGQNYKKWLVFAIDIDHAEHITSALIEKGVDAGVVHSKMDGDRDTVVEKFRNGEYRAIVNVDILTTGLDVPDIDLIAMLRPTQSPVIHVQTIGRGLRVAPGKTHCLVLDFAGNTQRLGPINDVRIQEKKKKGTGEAVLKECPKCQALMYAAMKFCDVCGHKFEFKTKLSTTSDTEEVVKYIFSETKWWPIDEITYGKTKSSLKVQYRVGTHTFTDYVRYGYTGFPKYRADNWIRFRAPDGMPMPKDVDQLYEWSPWLKKPTHVLVNFTDKFPKIKDVRFAQEIPVKPTTS